MKIYCATYCIGDGCEVHYDDIPYVGIDYQKAIESLDDKKIMSDNPELFLFNVEIQKNIFIWEDGKQVGREEIN